MGHADLYGTRSRFNITGPDIDQNDFAIAASEANCRGQVFWITTPVSGYWSKSLAKADRVVITATEAGSELTGTEMAYVLNDEATNQQFNDLDQDGELTLFDLYLATASEISKRFIAIQKLQTEHPQIDDIGDGRGSEIHDVAIEKPFPQIITKNQDGYLASKLRLSRKLNE